MAEEIKFEKAMERLEKIVADLESGDVSLEDALKKYEEGVRLSRTCQKKLGEAESKIETLTRSLDGSFKKEPFEYEEKGEDGGGQAKSRQKTKRNALKGNAVDKEDLLI